MKAPHSYANAVAISAQKSLIPKSRLLAAIDAKSADEALELLTATGFGKNAQISGVGEYEKLVEAETLALREFIAEYGDSSIEYFCLLKGDFFNCDVAFRHVRLGIKPSYTGDCITDVAAIEQYVATGKGEVPVYVKDAVAALDKAQKDGGTGAELSLASLKSYYATALKLIKRPFVKSIIRAEIDCANISAYFRSPDRETAEKQFIDGGKLKKEKLLVLRGSDTAKLRNAFMFSGYKDAIEACIKAKAEQMPLYAFEKIRDDYPMRKLYDKRYATEGITPVLLYAAYKRAEIRNFRTVISGKLAGADAEAIVGRLRDGYVG